MTPPDAGRFDVLAEPAGPLVFAGDWHGNGGWASVVVRRLAAAGARRFLHAGDFGIWPGGGGTRYLDRLQQTLDEASATLLFADGNHEDHTQIDALARDPRGIGWFRPRVAHAARGTRFTWGGLRFAVLGGATSVDRQWRTPMLDWWPQEELTGAQAEAFAAAGEVDVLVTHDCPAGVEIPGLHGRWPASELHRARLHQGRLRDVVDAVRPAVLVHGHFHVRYDAELVHDDGFVTTVAGLGTDGTSLRENTAVSTLDALAEHVAARRGGDPRPSSPWLDPERVAERATLGDALDDAG